MGNSCRGVLEVVDDIAEQQKPFEPRGRMIRNCLSQLVSRTQVFVCKSRKNVLYVGHDLFEVRFIVHLGWKNFDVKIYRSNSVHGDSELTTANLPSEIEIAMKDCAIFLMG